MSDLQEPENGYTSLNLKPQCSMTYFDFFNEYALIYKVKSYRYFRVKGDALFNTKIVIYLLRKHYHMTFKMISSLLMMSYQLANIYYYDILRDAASRDEADSRWKEINDVGNIPQSKAS